VKCKWKTVAKSCNEPKSCTVAKSCSFSSSWSSCLSDVTKAVSGQYRNYAELITKSGCSSIEACSKAVKGGLDSVWDELADSLQSGVKNIVEQRVIDKLPIDAGSIISSAKSGVDSAFGSIDLSAVNDFLSGIFGSFSKYDIDPCPPSGVNFWYMEPTDCGLFTHLSKVLTNMNNAESNFRQCEDALKECVHLTGAFGFPTPFLNFKIDSWCLPDFLETPLEYMLGAFQYAYNSGAALITELTTLATKLQDFVENNLGMNILQLGRDIKSQRLALLQSNATASTAGTWSLGTGICFDMPFPALTASVCYHLVWGEKDGNFVPPNVAYEIVLTRGIYAAAQFDAGEPEPGFTFALAFMDDYPGFLPASDPRIGAAAGMEIALDFEIQSVAEVGTALTVFFLPDPTAATGFCLGISVARDAATDLVQETMLAQAKEAQRQMHVQGQSHLATAAGQMTALRHLGSNIDTVLRKVQIHHAPALLQKVVEKPLHEYVPTSLGQSTQESSIPPVKVNGKIETQMAMAVCLTMPKCNGQGVAVSTSVTEAVPSRVWSTQGNSWLVYTTRNTAPGYTEIAAEADYTYIWSQLVGSNMAVQLMFRQTGSCISAHGAPLLSSYCERGNFNNNRFSSSNRRRSLGTGYCNSMGQYDDGEWHRLVLNAEASGSNRQAWTMYIDGVKYRDGSIDNLALDGQICMGGGHLDRSEQYELSRVAIWSRMLTSDEITSANANCFESTADGLLAYYPLDGDFNDALGGRALDVGWKEGTSSRSQAGSFVTPQNFPSCA